MTPDPPDAAATAGAASPAVGWAAWTPAPFRTAGDLGRPVLLHLHASWSAACRAFVAGPLRDDAVTGALRDAVVGVRVDVDDRPDIALRYTFAGWPALVLLTPEGAVLSQATAPAGPALARWLGGLLARWATAGPHLRREGAARLWQPPAPPAGRRAAREAVDVVLGRLVGAGGGAPRGEAEAAGTAPSLDAWQLVLDVFLERREPALAAWLAASAGEVLRRVGVGAGSSPAADGHVPTDEMRTLDALSAAGRVLAGAAAALRSPEFAHAARDVLAVVDRRLRRPRGAWRAASWPGGSDRVLVDAAARAAQAHLHAAVALEDPAFAERAVEALEFLASAGYHRSAGMAHVLDPSPRTMGLLADQVAMAEALLDAAEIAGRPAYADLAHELLRSALHRLWDERAGAFRDRVVSPAGAGDVGLLAHPVWPLDVNCAASRLLRRLAAHAGDETLAAPADRVLVTFGEAWDGDDTDAAAYALAVEAGA